MAIAENKLSDSAGRMRSFITITASSGHGGSIRPSSKLHVGYGLSKMFVIKPWRGYTINDIEVDGVSIDPVNMYMFTNLTEDHTISATFKRNNIATPQQPAG
jgi:hypothetical protein